MDPDARRTWAAQRDLRRLLLAVGLARALSLLRTRVNYIHWVEPALAAAVAAGTVASMPRNDPPFALDNLLGGPSVNDHYVRMFAMLLAIGFLVNLDSWKGLTFSRKRGR